MKTLVVNDDHWLPRDALPWCSLAEYQGPDLQLIRYSVVSVLPHGFAQSEDGIRSYESAIEKARHAFVNAARVSALDAYVMAKPAVGARSLQEMLDSAAAENLTPDLLILPAGVKFDATDSPNLRVRYAPPIELIDGTTLDALASDDGGHLAILTTSGASTGQVILEDMDVRVADPHNTHMWNCSAYVRGVITNPKNVLVFRIAGA